jgi:hypothetical protein
MAALETSVADNAGALDSPEHLEAADLATALAMSAAAAVAEAEEAEEAAQAAAADERQLIQSSGAETNNAAVPDSVIEAIDDHSIVTEIVEGAAASATESAASGPPVLQHDAIVDVIASAAPEEPSNEVSASPVETVSPDVSAGTSANMSPDAPLVSAESASPDVSAGTSSNMPPDAPPVSAESASPVVSAGISASMPPDAPPASAETATPDVSAGVSAALAPGGGGGVASRREEAGAPDEASLSAMMAMGLDRDWCVLALHRLRGDVESAVAFCFEHFEAMPRIVADAALERDRRLLQRRALAMQERREPRSQAQSAGDNSEDAVDEDEIDQLLPQLDEGPLNEAALQEMIQMGIPPEAAELGLRATSNVLELAMQFVFDRGDEMVALIPAFRRRRALLESSEPPVPQLRPTIAGSSGDAAALVFAAAASAGAANATATTTATSSYSESRGVLIADLPGSGDSRVLADLDDDEAPPIASASDSDTSEDEPVALSPFRPQQSAPPSEAGPRTAGQVPRRNAAALSDDDEPPPIASCSDSDSEEDAPVMSVQRRMERDRERGDASRISSLAVLRPRLLAHPNVECQRLAQSLSPDSVARLSPHERVRLLHTCERLLFGRIISSPGIPFYFLLYLTSIFLFSFSHIVEDKATSNGLVSRAPAAAPHHKFRVLGIETRGWPHVD